MSDRQYARKHLLTTQEFRKATIRALDLIAPHRCCLIGGLAVAYYSNPPVTIDVDFLVEGSMDEMEKIGDNFIADGWKRSRLAFPTNMRGAFRHGIQMERSHPLPAQVDVLMTGKSKFFIKAVKRSALVDILGIKIQVILPEDLIVLKLIAGRGKDTEDVVSMQDSLPNLNWTHIYAELEKAF